MVERTLVIEGVTVPRLLYGTAWKEDATQRLTELAVQQGFRGIDVANQRRHYDEAAVGRAISKTIRSGLLAREDLFLQTKFTFKAGQDHRLCILMWSTSHSATVAASARLSFDLRLISA